MDKKFKRIIYVGCFFCLVAVILKCLKSGLKSMYEMETIIANKRVYNRYNRNEVNNEQESDGTGH